MSTSPKYLPPVLQCHSLFPSLPQTQEELQKSKTNFHYTSSIQLYHTINSQPFHTYTSCIQPPFLFLILLTHHLMKAKTSRNVHCGLRNVFSIETSCLPCNSSDDFVECLSHSYPTLLFKETTHTYICTFNCQLNSVNYQVQPARIADTGLSDYHVTF